MNPALTIEQADAILDVVLEAGILEPPAPIEIDARLKSAAEVLQQAEAAKRAGVEVPAILKVIQIGLDLPFDLVDNEDTEPAAIPSEYEDAHESVRRAAQSQMDVPPILRPSPPIPIDNDSSEDTAAVSTDAKLIESDQEQESSPPPLPRDFSKVSDVELRSLHAVRYAHLSKTIFELGLETSDYESAQLNYETEYKRAMLGIDGKVTEKRDGAFLVPTVVDWREKIDEHHKKVIVLRAYRDLLQSEITGLSREYTMRTGERTATP